MKSLSDTDIKKTLYMLFVALIISVLFGYMVGYQEGRLSVVTEEKETTCLELFAKKGEVGMNCLNVINLHLK